MFKKFILPLIIILIPLIYFVTPVDSQSELEKKLEQIDEEFSGNLGVYVKNLADESEINYNSDRRWYLASTIKILVAIAILQKAEEGEISLEDEIVMNESDLVDGSGSLIWQKPGSSYSVKELILRMIRDSDSIAADMLIRLMGEEHFNEYIEENIIDHGVDYITTILRVRYEAYKELHDKAENLTNKDIINLKSFNTMETRLNAFMKTAGVKKDELKTETIPDAFEKYYEKGLNSGELQSMGIVLERLVEGEYLNEDHTDFLLTIMQEIVTGDRRIKAGLPTGTLFANKTGTQIGRAVNMGIIFPPNNEEPIIVAAAVEKHNNLREAEAVLEKVGRLITEKWLLQ